MQLIAHLAFALVGAIIVLPVALAFVVASAILVCAGSRRGRGRYALAVARIVVRTHARRLQR
jgi:hypothetical protein